ncbi:MAG: hypothetical protein ACPGSM_04135 [Thiolinea sp.]
MSTEVSNPFTAELVIEPVPSRLLIGFIVCIHFCALAVVYFVPGPVLIWRIALATAVILSLAYSLVVHSGIWPEKTVRKVYWREFGGWELEDGRGQHLPVILLENSFSRLSLTVLNFKTRKALGNKHYTVILLKDNCRIDIRLRLRRRIKLNYS